MIVAHLVAKVERSGADNREFHPRVESDGPRRFLPDLKPHHIGAAILRDASAAGYSTACQAEKSGQDEFDFEYGEEFAKHIEDFDPTFCKVLVRYNPEGEEALNRRQSARLRQLSEYLHDKGRSMFMFELLVPAEKAQLDRLKGDKKAYDLELRSGLMARVIEELGPGAAPPARRRPET